MALTPSELAERFDAIAQDDPKIRIDLRRMGADTVATLAAGAAHPESTRRFRDLAVDAVALFDPDGTGDETERWLRQVSECVPDRIRNDALGGMIHNAAEVSALAVLRLRVPVSEATVSAALVRCPTLLDALNFLHRRNDIRPTIRTERKDGREHRTHLAGEPIALALTWVHSRCTWQSRRNGAELWDYVSQSARGGIVDAEVREAVVPQLRELDTPEMRRALWSELLSRFPHIATDLPVNDSAGGVAITPTHTDWHEVQRRLQELYDRGDPYSSLRVLADRLKCSKATIHKAINDSTKLKGWQARHAKAKGSPRASSLTEVVLDNTKQTREPDPSEAAEADNVDNVFARLIQEAKPEERAKLKLMTSEQCRQIVDLLNNDPDNYNRVLGRTP